MMNPKTQPLPLAEIDRIRADHARAVAHWHATHPHWHATHPGEDVPADLDIRNWFVDHAFRGTPRIGDWFCNIYASETNPERLGMFLRRRGTYYETTDCRGSFWAIPADALVLVEAPADAPLVRRESR